MHSLIAWVRAGSGIASARSGSSRSSWQTVSAGVAHPAGAGRDRLVVAESVCALMLYVSVGEFGAAVLGLAGTRTIRRSPARSLLSGSSGDDFASAGGGDGERSGRPRDLRSRRRPTRGRVAADRELDDLIAVQRCAGGRARRRPGPRRRTRPLRRRARSRVGGCVNASASARSTSCG